MLNILAYVPLSLVKFVDRYRTDDGGASQKSADLWCTYAAIRALAWLNQQPQDTESCISYLLNCQNPDGGFAWQRGLRSDIWATYYCTQSLQHLGVSVPSLAQLRTWLYSLTTPEGGFSMTPGQSADIWATYYAVRTVTELLQEKIFNTPQLKQWLISTQQPSGGLSWNSGQQPADTRACYYGVIAWEELGMHGSDAPDWNREALIEWLHQRQTDEGGFVFDEEHDEPCLWATFRATNALRALGSEPLHRQKCIEWIRQRKQIGSGFCRWRDYPVVDVWACFCAIGALDALGAPLQGEEKTDVIAFLYSCQMPHSGFTYRHPSHAGESLATSAVSLVQSYEEKTRQLNSLNQRHDKQTFFQWLIHAHMRYEDGIMYMPGRGAEIRCSLWAIATMNESRTILFDKYRFCHWFKSIQNPDGGFGYWHGRGSDLVSTVSTLECLMLLKVENWGGIDSKKAAQFLLACLDPNGIKFSPNGDISLSSICQGIRGCTALGLSSHIERYLPFLDQYASRIGGYSAQPSGIPDLMSTYQVALTQQRLQLPWNMHALKQFLKRIQRKESGYAWSPLTQNESGPLAFCLGYILQTVLAEQEKGNPLELPPLNL